MLDLLELLVGLDQLGGLSLQGLRIGGAVRRRVLPRPHESTSAVVSSHLVMAPVLLVAGGWLFYRGLSGGPAAVRDGMSVAALTLGIVLLAGGCVSIYRLFRALPDEEPCRERRSSRRRRHRN